MEPDLDIVETVVVLVEDGLRAREVVRVRRARAPRHAREPVEVPASESRRRCGRGEPSPGADVARVSPIPAQMWQG